MVAGQKPASVQLWTSLHRNEVDYDETYFLCSIITSAIIVYVFSKENGGCSKSVNLTVFFVCILEGYELRGTIAIGFLQIQWWWLDEEGDCTRKGVCRWFSYFRGDLVKLFCIVKLFVLLSVAKHGYSASSNYNGKSILALCLAKHA